MVILPMNLLPPLASYTAQDAGRIGYRGSCFPKDVRALDHLAFTEGLNLKLVKSVIQISNRQRLLPLQVLRQRLAPTSPH